jgi:hypothetical protein
VHIGLAFDTHQMAHKCAALLLMLALGAAAVQVSHLFAFTEFLQRF